ncbi:hypothetical protein [Leucobacter sp. wl10]|uniref:hypothetical protein n=1 Tax=Leucobacter sp. wl10 TaxID=2304677 RepID=UPI000E5BF39A|nr:hypothetical protein [Leucobacter sp. wl10]RGE23798.1 hypothetical protein D1J51_02250 [Leucobacter sp. wl10]
MKIRTRIAIAVTAALASVFAAAPAFANAGNDSESMFSTAGDPLDIVAISVVGVVLLAIVLIGSTLIGNLFVKKK